jgi:ribose 5-phosphate isomerase B
LKIAISSDHRGFAAKEKIKGMLKALGHEVLDFGTDSDASCDYPDITYPTCAAVTRDEADRGILLCGTGIGVDICANKVGGIRAALCHDELTAEMSRRHNKANVLCLPADLIGDEIMRRIVDVWLKTEFAGGRHERRIAKIEALEDKWCRTKPNSTPETHESSS